MLLHLDEGSLQLDKLIDIQAAVESGWSCPVWQPWILQTLDIYELQDQGSWRRCILWHKVHFLSPTHIFTRILASRQKHSPVFFPPLKNLIKQLLLCL